MATSIIEVIRPTVEECIHKYQLNRMAVAVQRDGEQVETLALGNDPAGCPLEGNSLFPVASITKLATALAVLRLYDRGLLELDDSLERFVPQAASAQPGVTVRRLLCHTSGVGEVQEEFLPPREELSWPSFAQAILKVKLIASPGNRMIYSSAGYDLLGIVIERVAGQPVQRVIRELVFEPLGVECTLGVEPPRPAVYFHEPKDPFAGTPLADWNTPFWQQIGFPSGGMLATLPATIGLLRAFGGHPAGYLRQETCAEAGQDQTGGLGGEIPTWIAYPRFEWGLGPIPLGTKANFPFAPAGADPSTFCMGGYTGCLVLREPMERVTWATHCVQEMDDEKNKALSAVGAAVLAAYHT